MRCPRKIGEDLHSPVASLLNKGLTCMSVSSLTRSAHALHFAAVLALPKPHSLFNRSSPLRATVGRGYITASVMFI
eukprot:1380455-Pyramimonas_sp.AAC.1